jgi:hypothetical protein
MAPDLKAAGPVKTITFVQAEQISGERYEQYRVIFTNGAPSSGRSAGCGMASSSRSIRWGTDVSPWPGTAFPELTLE